MIVEPKRRVQRSKKALAERGRPYMTVSNPLGCLKLESGMCDAVRDLARKPHVTPGLDPGIHLQRKPFLEGDGSPGQAR